MDNQQIHELTDVIYRALFDMDGAALRIKFGLSPRNPDDVSDDDLRDCMGTIALEVLSYVEDFGIRLYQLGVTDETCKRQLRESGKRWRIRGQERANIFGVDFLTGEKRNVDA